MQGSLEHASPINILVAVIIFVTGGGFVKLLSWWSGRGIQAASARKLEAEARQVDVQVQQMRGDIVLEFVDRLSNQQLRIDQLIRERDEWRQKTEAEQGRNRALEMQLEEIKKQS